MMKLSIARGDLKGHRSDSEELIVKEANNIYNGSRIRYAVTNLIKELVQEQLDSLNEDETTPNSSIN